MRMLIMIVEEVGKMLGDVERELIRIWKFVSTPSPGLALACFFGGWLFIAVAVFMIHPVIGCGWIGATLFLFAGALADVTRKKGGSVAEQPIPTTTPNEND